MVDERRMAKFTDGEGRFAPKLPVYTSTGIITQNDGLEVAISKLDNALDNYTHKQLDTKDDPTDPNYQHVTETIQAALYGANSPSALNVFATMADLTSTISAWGLAVPAPGDTNGLAIIDFSSGTIVTGTGSYYGNTGISYIRPSVAGDSTYIISTSLLCSYSYAVSGANKNILTIQNNGHPPNRFHRYWFFAIGGSPY